jgi:hypothetical protein
MSADDKEKPEKGFPAREVIALAEDRATGTVSDAKNYSIFVVR